MEAVLASLALSDHNRILSASLGADLEDMRSRLRNAGWVSEQAHSMVRFIYSGEDADFARNTIVESLFSTEINPNTSDELRLAAAGLLDVLTAEFN